MNRLSNDIKFNANNTVTTEKWSIRHRFPNFFWGVYMLWVGPVAFYNNLQYLRSSSISYGEKAEYVHFPDWQISPWTMTFDLSYGPHGTIFQYGNIEISLLFFFFGTLPRFQKNEVWQMYQGGAWGTPPPLSYSTNTKALDFNLLYSCSIRANSIWQNFNLKLESHHHTINDFETAGPIYSDLQLCTRLLKRLTCWKLGWCRSR